MYGRGLGPQNLDLSGSLILKVYDRNPPSQICTGAESANPRRPPSPLSGALPKKKRGLGRCGDANVSPPRTDYTL